MFLTLRYIKQMEDCYKILSRKALYTVSLCPSHIHPIDTQNSWEPTHLPSFFSNSSVKMYFTVSEAPSSNTLWSEHANGDKRKLLLTLTGAGKVFSPRELSVNLSRVQKIIRNTTATFPQGEAFTSRV